MRPKLITPPASSPVSLEELKLHLRIDHDDEDDLLQSYLDAAVSRLDGATGTLGRCLISQEWSQGFSQWSAELRLPFPDVSAAAITYFDSDDVSQAVSAADFEVLEGRSWTVIAFRDSFAEPSLSDTQLVPITVTLTAGYGGSSSDVPRPIRVAIMHAAAHWHSNREVAGDAGELPLNADRLLSPYRRVRL